MPRLDANLMFLFTEHAPLERPRAAAKAGFNAVEYQFPYEVPAEEYARACRDAGVELVLINSPPGDWAKGDRGIAALPERADEFTQSLETMKRYCDVLGVKRINLMAGVPGATTKRDAAEALFVENLARTARALAPLGVTVCVEPLNARDVPGFLLARSDETIRVLDRCGEKNVALQYDFYHMQIMEGDLIPTMTRLKDRIGHMQFADTPGRHEPGTGEINYARIFEAIDAIGYRGWVGAEYKPSRRTEETFQWFRAS
jgi:hydroxypyruvate isomerase